MSNENKKVWVSLIVPIIFVVVLMNFSESLGLLITFIVTLPFFLIFQFGLTKLLNKKFPSKADWED